VYVQRDALLLNLNLDSRFNIFLGLQIVDVLELHIGQDALIILVFVGAIFVSWRLCLQWHLKMITMLLAGCKR